MPEPLNHIRQKLYRADEHILQVRNGVDSIIASIPDRVVPKDDVDAVRRLRHTLALISIPEPLHIVAGEAIHQTRSALDHFAAQLAGTKWSDKTEFPIQVHRPVKPDEIGRFEREIEGFPLFAATIIKDLQPYKLPESRREDYWLTILKRLNNRDKHRALLTTAIVAKPQFKILIGGGESSIWIPDDDTDPAIAELESSVNVESQLTPAIVFPEFGSAINVDVISGLNALRFHVGEIIGRFKIVP